MATMWLRPPRTKWAPIIAGMGRTRNEKPRVPIINIGTDNAKNQWLSILDVEKGEPGYDHFPTEEQGYGDGNYSDECQ